MNGIDLSEHCHNVCIYIFITLQYKQHITLYNPKRIPGASVSENCDNDIAEENVEECLY